VSSHSKACTVKHRDSIFFFEFREQTKVSAVWAGAWFGAVPAMLIGFSLGQIGVVSDKIAGLKRKPYVPC
jgi:hypothetical protein